MKKPDIVLGDMNVVEEAIDRMPAHPDYGPAVEALRDMKSLFRVTDGWRRHFPNDVEYSFYMTNRPIQSRIDRIYLKKELIQYSWEWKIKCTGINTDHLMVSAKILSPRQPPIEEGRYAMPICILKDEELIARIIKIGKGYEETLAMVKTNCTLDSNPQTAHKMFKEKVVNEIC